VITLKNETRKELQKALNLYTNHLSKKIHNEQDVLKKKKMYESLNIVENLRFLIPRISEIRLIAPHKIIS